MTTGKIKVDSNNYTANYPILDPLGAYNATKKTGVEGFTIAAAPGSSVTSWTPDPAYNPVDVTKAGTTANPAPMPVRWIYVLKDGSFTTPAPSCLEHRHFHRGGRADHG